MKKVLALFVGIMLWGMAVTAQAVPMYYTFGGNVSSLNDGAGIIADAGLAVGSPVSYTFLVDFDTDGTYTLNDGTVYPYPDNSTTDYFYTDYISGSALQQKNGGYYNFPGNTAEYNFGYNYVPGSDGYLYGNSFDDGLRIYSYTMLVSDWVVGDAVSGHNWAFDSTGASSSLLANLTLTGISAATPVPEPATMLLLGSGLIGMFGLKKKKYSKS